MLIDEALRTHALSKTAITNVVQSRIYEIAAPQNALYPHITYNAMSGDRLHSLTGASGLNRAVFHWHFWAKKPADAKNLSEQFRLAFDGFRGQMGGSGGVNVQALFMDDDVDLYDDEAFIFHVVRKVTVWHQEPKPTL